MDNALSSHHVVRAQAFTNVAHGFFTRLGGVSAPPYDTLNASETVNDRTEDVLKNRTRVAASLGVAANALLTAAQFHSARVVTVTNPTQLWRKDAPPQADAIVCTLPGRAVGVLTADCAPVLFSDAYGTVVAAAHAGWRGAAAGVLENTLAAMRLLGAKEVTAVVGPCIGPRHYEVAEDMRSQVMAADLHAHAYFFKSKRLGHFQFDLSGYCMHRLRRAGLRLISQIKLDTLSDPQRFFSHRRMTLAGAARTGRQISAIKVGRTS